MIFTKDKVTRLDGQTVVQFTEKTEEAAPFPFTITCSSAGILFTGNMQKEISSNDDLQSFAKTVADAWVEHTKLAPKIITTLAGH